MKKPRRPITIRYSRGGFTIRLDSAAFAALYGAILVDESSRTIFSHKEPVASFNSRVVIAEAFKTFVTQFRADPPTLSYPIPSVKSVVKHSVSLKNL